MGRQQPSSSCEGFLYTSLNCGSGRDKKREINILRQDALDQFFEDLGEIMKYKPSNQFVSEDLKKTENPRIISP